MRRPRLIVLQPTPYCNIRCTYCYLGNRDDKRLMSNAVMEAIREKIFANLDAVLFTHHCLACGRTDDGANCLV